MVMAIIVFWYGGQRTSRVFVAVLLQCHQQIFVAGSTVYMSLLGHRTYCIIVFWSHTVQYTVQYCTVH